MSTIGTLSAKWEADTAQYLTATRAATAATKEAGASMQSLSRAATQEKLTVASVFPELAEMRKKADELAAAQKAAASATTALAGTLKAMAVGTAITLGISLIINAIQTVIERAREAREALKEMAEDAARDMEAALKRFDPHQHALNRQRGLVNQRALLQAQLEAGTGRRTTGMAASDATQVGPGRLGDAAAADLRERIRVLDMQIATAGLEVAASAPDPRGGRSRATRDPLAGFRSGVDAQLDIISEIIRINRVAAEKAKKGGGDLDQIVADTVAPFREAMDEYQRIQKRVAQDQLRTIREVEYGVGMIMSGIVSTIRMGSVDIIGAFRALIEEIMKAAKGAGSSPLAFLGNVAGGFLGIPGLGDVLDTLFVRQATTLNLRVGSPMTPREAARDRDWLNVLQTSLDVSIAQGYRVQVAS